METRRPVRFFSVSPLQQIPLPSSSHSGRCAPAVPAADAADVDAAADADVDAADADAADADAAAATLQ